MPFFCSLALTSWAEQVTWPLVTSNGWVSACASRSTTVTICYILNRPPPSCYGSRFHGNRPALMGFTQQTVKKFLALAQRFRLPLFLTDTAALTLLSQDALRQRDRLVLEPHCSFLCTGRPITSFALHANLWKYDVSVWCVHSPKRKWEVI